MEELLTLRKKVESLERDVGGLEAIVRNLDSIKEQEDTVREEQFSLIKQLNCYIYLLYLDTMGNRPFVPPDREPNEDEPVSTICIIYCCCVFRKAIGFKPTCIYRVTKLCGGIRASRGVPLVCIIVTTVKLKTCVVLGNFLYIDPPIH